MNGTEVTQVLQGRFRAIGGPTVFLKIDTEDDKTRCAGSLSYTDPSQYEVFD